MIVTLDNYTNLPGCYIICNLDKEPRLITRVANPKTINETTAYTGEWSSYTMDYLNDYCEILTKEDNPEYFL